MKLIGQIIIDTSFQCLTNQSDEGSSEGIGEIFKKNSSCVFYLKFERIDTFGVETKKWSPVLFTQQMNNCLSIKENRYLFLPLDFK